MDARLRPWQIWGSAGVKSPCAAAIIMAAARSQPDRSSGRQQTSLRKCMLFILRLRSAIFAVVTSAEIIPSRQRGQFASSYIRIGEFVPELPRNPNHCVTPDPESHDYPKRTSSSAAALRQPCWRLRLVRALRRRRHRLHAERFVAVVAGLGRPGEHASGCRMRLVKRLNTIPESSLARGRREPAASAGDRPAGLAFPKHVQAVRSDVARARRTGTVGLHLDQRDIGGALRRNFLVPARTTVSRRLRPRWPARSTVRRFLMLP